MKSFIQISFYVAEGFTCYYGDLTLVRSKVWDKEKYLKNLAKHITMDDKTYGRTVTTLAESSFNSWISHYQMGNPNQHISFYLKGELVGLLLDIEIRKASNNKHSLDTVMRKLYTDLHLKIKDILLRY